MNLINDKISDLLFYCVMTIGNDLVDVYPVFARELVDSSGRSQGVLFTCDFPSWHYRWRHHHIINGEHRLEFIIYAKCKENTHLLSSDVFVVSEIQHLMASIKLGAEPKKSLPIHIGNIPLANDYDDLFMEMSFEVDSGPKHAGCLYLDRFSIILPNDLCNQWLETHKKYIKFGVKD